MPKKECCPKCGHRYTVTYFEDCLDPDWLQVTDAISMLEKIQEKHGTDMGVLIGTLVETRTKIEERILP